MAIKIEQEQSGNTRILALSGRLDTETSADVELALQDLLAAGERNFLIDMTDIGYVSSAGLRVLLATAKQLEGGKGSLRLCGLNPSVRQVFDVAGFSKLFALFPDRIAALGEAGKVRPEAVLAGKIAALLGVKSVTDSLHPKAMELARIATQMLGLKPLAASASKSQSIPAVGAAGGKVKAPKDATPQPGVLGKIKGLFGGKT